MAQDFLATLVCWDAAMSGTLAKRELYAARELYATFDPRNRREEVQAGLLKFAQQRLQMLPLPDADAATVKRVFAALPFGPMDDVCRQLVFVLWLWSRFDRERIIVQAALRATRGALLGEVKRLTELHRPIAEQAAPLAAEALSVDDALERFLSFLGQAEHPPAWGLRLSMGLAQAALAELPSPSGAAVAPEELVAAVWCSYRIDGQPFAAIATSARQSL